MQASSALTVDGNVLRLFWELAAVESSKREVCRLSQPGHVPDPPACDTQEAAAGLRLLSSEPPAGCCCSARRRPCGSTGQLRCRVRSGVACGGLAVPKSLRKLLTSMPRRGDSGPATLAPLVSYSLRRLARGLSSGREVRPEGAYGSSS